MSHQKQPKRKFSTPRSRRPAAKRAIITPDDRRRLGGLFVARIPRPKPAVLNALLARLEDAICVEQHEIPPTVVTMNSTVELVAHGSGELRVIRLVYPDDVEFVEGAVSVLEPLGIRLLGSSVDDEIRTKMATFNVRRILHQPEQSSLASGERLQVSP